jgi:hypothetical protein
LLVEKLQSFLLRLREHRLDPPPLIFVDRASFGDHLGVGPAA